MVQLAVDRLTKRFGGLVAVNDVTFEVEPREILSIIGPNGAGKSTLFKLVCGFLPPSSGDVTFEGRSLLGQKPHEIARLGVVRTFQETTIFKEMTALENVVVGHHLRCRANSFGIFAMSPTAREDERRFEASAAEILDYLGLGRVKNERARNLPHGYLRALSIAVAMAGEPKVLLLDEPFAGMNMDETDHAVDMVEGIRQRGVTVLLVEHDMRAVMRISDRVAVLNFGNLIALGPPREIQDDQAVIEAYLGKEDEAIGA